MAHIQISGIFTAGRAPDGGESVYRDEITVSFNVHMTDPPQVEVKIGGTDMSDDAQEALQPLLLVCAAAFPDRINFK